MRKWLIAVVFVAGCGGGDELSGTSWFALSGGVGTSLSFDDSHGYAMAAGFSSGGSFQLEVQRGTYAISGGSLTFSARESSCPNTPRSASERFALSGSTLAIGDASDAIVFARDSGDPPNGAISYGCFDASGAFAPMAIHPVQ